MKLKNHEIEQFAKFIFEFELNGKSSRMRSRLIKTIEDYLKDVFDKERMSIIETYAMRDENNEILLNESKTEAILNPEKREIFYSELDELMNEDFIIEETETNQDMILAVADALLNCDAILTGKEATLYYYWCEEFEGAIARYGNKEAT